MDGERPFSRKYDNPDHHDSPPYGRDYSPVRKSLPERRRLDDYRDYREPPPFRDRARDDEAWKRGHSPPHKRFRRDTRYDWERDRKYKGKRYEDSRYRRQFNWRENKGLFEGPMMPFSKFVRDIPDHHEPEKVYNEYQNEYAKRQIQSFFAAHKGDVWFQEKYHPASIATRIEKTITYSTSRAKQFTEDWTQIKNDSSRWKLDFRDEPPAAPSDSAERCVIVQNVPPTYSHANLERVLSKAQDCVVESVEYLEVNPQNGFTRDAKVKFQTVEQAKQAMETLEGTSDDEFVFRLTAYKPEWKYKISTWFDPAEALENDLAVADKLIQQLDKERHLPAFLEELSQIEPLQNRLDLYLFYLRYVHLYCYYCAAEFLSEDELYSKCGVLHLRADASSSQQSDKDALKERDKKNQQRIESPPNPDMLTGEAALRSAQQDFYDSNVRRMEEKKYRCAVPNCAKLFCGFEFVIKHINLKHKHLLDALPEQAQQQQFLDNFENDYPNLPKSFFGSENNIPSRGPPPHGRYGGGRGFKRDHGYKPFPPRFPPQHLEPPPGVQEDPRSLRNYVDLDAPPEDISVINYRTQISYDNI